jgi:hypothetical protein
VLVTRAARQIKHDHEMQAALVQSTVGALAFLVKAFEDLVTSAATVFLAGTSECQPKRQLNLAAGPGRTGDRCYIPRTHIGSGESELGSVKRIEHFRAERQFPLCPQPKTLGQGQVEVRPSRSAEHVPRCVAEIERGWSAERRGIEPLRDRPIIWIQGFPGYDIRPASPARVGR